LAIDLQPCVDKVVREDDLWTDIEDWHRKERIVLQESYKDRWSICRRIRKVLEERQYRWCSATKYGWYPEDAEVSWVKKEYFPLDPEIWEDISE
jgi:hypothetical protein